MFMDPLGLPSTWSLAAFGRAWDAGMGRYLLNSALVTAASVAVAASRLEYRDAPACPWPGTTHLVFAKPALRGSMRPMAAPEDDSDLRNDGPSVNRSVAAVMTKYPAAP